MELEVLYESNWDPFSEGGWYDIHGSSEFLAFGAAAYTGHVEGNLSAFIREFECKET